MTDKEQRRLDDLAEMLEELTGIAVPRPCPEPPPHRPRAEVRRDVCRSLSEIFDGAGDELSRSEIRLGRAAVAALRQGATEGEILDVLAAFGATAPEKKAKPQRTTEKLRELENRIKSEDLQFPVRYMLEGAEKAGFEAVEGWIVHACKTLEERPPNWYLGLGLVLQRLLLAVQFEHEQKLLKRTAQQLERSGQPRPHDRGVKKKPKKKPRATRAPRTRHRPSRPEDPRLRDLVEMLEELSGIEVPRPCPPPPPRRREVEVRRDSASALRALLEDEAKTEKLTPAELRLGHAVATAMERAIPTDLLLGALGRLDVDTAKDEASRAEEIAEGVRELQLRLKSEAMQFPFSLFVEAMEAVGYDHLEGFVHHCIALAKVPQFYKGLGLLLQMVTFFVFFEQRPRNLHALVEVLEALGGGGGPRSGGSGSPAGSSRKPCCGSYPHEPDRGHWP